MPYHPQTNPTELPPVTDVASLDKLPWGGNHWWDWPIMRYVDKVVGDTTKPRELRKAICARAGFLMTGEDCKFQSEEEFNDYLRHLSH